MRTKKHIRKRTECLSKCCYGSLETYEKRLPSSDEFQNEVDRKANEWKKLSITKKSKMTDFWSGVQKKSTNVTIKLSPTASQESTESSLEPTKSMTLNDIQSSIETTPSEASIPTEERKERLTLKMIF